MRSVARGLAALDRTSRSKLAAIRADIENHRTHLAEVRAEAQALAREAEICRHAGSRRSQSERESWTARNEGAASQITTLDTRVDEAKTERASLDDAPRLFEREARRADRRDRDRRGRTAAPPPTASPKPRTQLAEADRDARAALEALSAAREDAARAEERYEGGKRRLADIDHEISEMLEVEPAEVAALAELNPDKPLARRRRHRGELERLRRERERLGAVNLRADEELREVETQHTTLTSERDDLVEAIKRLRQGIQSLNKEARERLLASFEVVNDHFKHLFSELFGGGTADLQLIEAEDPLEAGLEIIAKPPGKKPRRCRCSPAASRR